MGPVAFIAIFAFVGPVVFVGNLINFTSTLIKIEVRLASIIGILVLDISRYVIVVIARIDFE